MATIQQVSTNYPFLTVRIQIRNWQHETPALIDTGFEGSLVIPSSALESGLGDPDTSSNWILADGSIVETPVYLGTLEIVGLPSILNIAVTVLGSEYILGRRVIDRYEVTLDHGERLTVRP